MRLVCRVALLLLGLSATAVVGGPDHHGAPYFCKDLYKGLKSELCHAVRDTVQALQSAESYLGQAQLGRPLPLSSVSTSAPNASVAREWKEANATKLQRLLEDTDVARGLGGGVAAAAVARSCMSTRLRPDLFAGRPVVSLLLEYFKRPAVVTRIAAVLRRNCAEVSVPCELVVNVDNPHEADAWAAEVAGGFVVPVFSANVHEARGYNRAARVARGRYLVIWQDDQIPPERGQWLVDMVKVFDAHSHLGILGMNTYRLCKHKEPTNRHFYTNWEPDAKTGVKWSFAQTVDFAPLAIRASIFEALGGLDESPAQPGDCGIWGDWELCARAWMDGWTVGYMYLDGRSGDGEPGGTHVGASGERCWGRQQYVASSLFQKRYGAEPLQSQWCDQVWLLNMLNFKLGTEGCPYGSRETNYANCTALSPEREAEATEELAAIYGERRGRGGGAGVGAAGHAEEAGQQAAASAGAVADAGDAKKAASGAVAEPGNAKKAAPAADLGGRGGILDVAPQIVRGGARRQRLRLRH